MADSHAWFAEEWASPVFSPRWQEDLAFTDAMPSSSSFSIAGDSQAGFPPIFSRSVEQAKLNITGDPTIDFEITDGADIADELFAPRSLRSRLSARLKPRWDLPGEVFGSMVEDQRNIYSRESLMQWGIFFAIGGAMANSHADVGTLDPLRENLVNTPSDEYANYLHEHRYLGNGYILLPAYAGLAIIGKGIGEKPLMPVVGEWGERSMRGIIVGVIPLLAMQELTGGSRPGETSHTSHWQPFRDNNGVSGHAFMGAVPLLTAAHMTDRIWLKAVFCTASALPGLSRVTDGAHYPSQVFLGWSLAYVATSAIQQTSHDRVQVQPWIDLQNTGLTLSTSW